jgi:hypothetical protein
MKKTNKRYNLVLILGIITLLLGSSLYLIKPSNTIGFKILFELPLIGNYLCEQHQIITSTITNNLNHNFLYKIVFNYISDGLWILSLQMIIAYIWELQHKMIIILYTFFIAVTFEIFQFLKIVPGVFDFFDIITYLIFSIFGILILKNKLEYKQNEIII